eukprot:g3105.t1
MGNECTKLGTSVKDVIYKNGGSPVETDDDESGEDLTIRKSRSMFYDTYTQKHLLGKGHFAQVFLGENNSTKEKVAIKRINVAKSKAKHIEVEINALSKVGRHPNVIELYGVFNLESCLVLVLELCTGGELFEYLVQMGPYSEEECAKNFRDICSAISFLHKNGVVHRDLKPENILLSSHRDDAILKIADFGLSKILDDPSSSDSFVMKSRVGTWMYAAPEVRRPLKGGFGYTNTVDVWSCGVILYVMLAGYHPFDPL